MLPLLHLIANRRSIRSFAPYELSDKERTKLLCAGNTIPSAGGLYPLRLIMIWNNIILGTDQPIAIPKELTKQLAQACCNQMFMQDASCIIIISLLHKETLNKYGERGWRYIYMEAGHAAQNIALQAEELGLSTCMIGAFDDATIEKLLNVEPLYLIAVGKEKHA